MDNPEQADRMGHAGANGIVRYCTQDQMVDEALATPKELLTLSRVAECSMSTTSTRPLSKCIGRFDYSDREVRAAYRVAGEQVLDLLQKGKMFP